MVEIILLVVLIVLVVALFVISYMKKKKFNGELGQMREELKVGDKVMTDTGVVGVVVDSYVEDEYKYFVLQSGKGANIGYFTVHANAIYYVFDKEKQEDKKVVVKVAPKQENSSTEPTDKTEAKDTAKSKDVDTAPKSTKSKANK